MCNFKNLMARIGGAFTGETPAKERRQQIIENVTAGQPDSPQAQVTADTELVDKAAADQAKAVADALAEARKAAMPVPDNEQAQKAKQERQRQLLAQRGMAATMRGTPTGAAPVSYRVLFGS